MRALAVFVAALALYLGTAALLGKLATPDAAYFDRLADAFLHGRLDLVSSASTQDLTPFAGRWYVPFPPLAALLMVPLVLVLGSFSTVAFCAVFGAATVCLVFLILVGLTRRGWVPLDDATIGWLTALFGAGCVHWSMAVTGSVWFVGQVCAVTFCALAVAVAIWAPRRAAAWIGGVALGLAALGRPDLVLTWPLIAGIARQRRHAHPVRWAAISLVLVAVAGVLSGLYNQARFGSPFDFGYAAENVAGTLTTTLAEHGQFGLSYLPQNLWTMLLAGPAPGTLLPDPRGMSLLLTTPALLFLARTRGSSPLVRGAWIALLALMAPLLLYYNTGWAQFGYRFSLEFMVPVIVLLAVAVAPRAPLTFRVLVAVGIVINAAGTVWWLLR